MCCSYSHSSPDHSKNRKTSDRSMPKHPEAWGLYYRANTRTQTNKGNDSRRPPVKLFTRTVLIVACALHEVKSWCKDILKTNWVASRRGQAARLPGATLTCEPTSNATDMRLPYPPHACPSRCTAGPNFTRRRNHWSSPKRTSLRFVGDRARRAARRSSLPYPRRSWRRVV